MIHIFRCLTVLILAESTGLVEVRGWRRWKRERLTRTVLTVYSGVTRDWPSRRGLGMVQLLYGVIIDRPGILHYLICTLHSQGEILLHTYLLHLIHIVPFVACALLCEKVKYTVEGLNLQSMNYQHIPPNNSFKIMMKNSVSKVISLYFS